MIYTEKSSILLAILVVLVSGCLTCTASSDIDSVLFDFFKEYVILKPEYGTRLDLPSEWNIPVDHGALDDVSDTGDDKLYGLYEKYRDILKRFDENSLTRSQLVLRATLLWYLDDQLEGRKYRYHTYIMNPMFSFHNQLTTLMTEYHTISDKKDAEDYIERLTHYDERVEQLIEQIEIRKQKRMLAPRFVVETFVKELEAFIAVPVEENVLYRAFARKVQGITDINNETRDTLLKNVHDRITKYVYPAYQKIIEYINGVKFFTDQKAGVWKLPDGDKYYEYCLHHHTTTKLSLQEIHMIGIDEVARIQKEIIELYKQLGIKPGRSYAEMTTEYWQLFYKEPYVYTADEHGKQQTLADYQAIIDGMYEHLPELFSLVPEKKVRVAMVPDYKEKTAGTFYEPASFDPASEGIFYANLSYPHFKPGMKTLTYHEAIPGHHLQFAIEIESPAYHPVKSLFFFTGYAEGWALYAEKLAREQGMYDDIHNQIGNLRSELFRAVRLVVDTGIHWKKWTREEAYEYMRDNTGWAGYGEIDRYITWPGQACSYKVGEIAMLALRDVARQQLGDAFDIKEFHQVVLEHGSVPLEILEELVEDYITEQRTEGSKQ